MDESQKNAILCEATEFCGRKRRSSEDMPASPVKRARTDPTMSFTPTPDQVAQQGLRRAIAMTLQQVGFNSASAAALSSFEAAVQEYLDAFIRDMKRSARTARRDQTNPVDFESTLHRYDLPPPLPSYLRSGIKSRLLEPEFTILNTADPDFLRLLPTLGPELSGKTLKDSLEYLPKTFPEFPSRHTFMSTWPDEDSARQDSEKVREDAAKAAKQGEDALRGLLRAAKIPKQKEIRSQVERDPFARERHRLWEAAMTKLLQSGKGGGFDAYSNDEVQTAIANASMLVNAEGHMHRKEVPQSGRRVASASGGQ